MESTEAQQRTETSPVQPQPVDSHQETPSAPSKPIHTLIIDTGPLIKNDPPVSTLLAQAEELYTLPSVLPEIKDAATRARVETQLLPFLKLRSPRPDSIKFVTDFARRTGDLEVLSRPDLHLIALAYELECERNGGDWRLRKEPGQKRTNGKSPAQIAKDEAAGIEQEAGEGSTSREEDAVAANTPEGNAHDNIATEESNAPVEPIADQANEVTEESAPVLPQEAVTHQLDTLTLEPERDIKAEDSHQTESQETVDDDEDDDEGGWITPSNLKKHQQKDQQSSPEQPIQRVLQVALLTSDYAMQNVLLRINLNLVSPSLARITRVKTWVLRCHGCFQITRSMDKQFCPKCGQPTLTRVSCSTDQSGNFQVHLKKNFQWNNRGNVYSVPKPVHGTANGKYRGQGGGQKGWGRDLILAEDQKEYKQKTDNDRRLRQRDLMDEDYLPGLLTGYRQSGPGKARVGAGRNVNSKKRS
ncbi:20s-pre-rrna d-site endonuclease nob1 [Seiridium cupressi]